MLIFSESDGCEVAVPTGNADTVYYMGAVDLSKGPMVIEQPPKGLGMIDDMWFSWIIHIGFPGPGSRRRRQSTCSYPLALTVPFPRAASSLRRRKPTACSTGRVRSWSNDDPKPAVEIIKQPLKIYPYTPGGAGTSIATALDGKVRPRGPPSGPRGQVRGGQAARRLTRFRRTTTGSSR